MTDKWIGPRVLCGDSNPPPDGYEYVRRYAADVRLAAGSGTTVENENVAGYVAFRRDWMRRHGLRAERCSLVDVTGDSMEPELFDGDSALVDHSRCDPVEGEIFALRTLEGPLVKRLRFHDDRWWASSDNDLPENGSRPLDGADGIRSAAWSGARARSSRVEHAACRRPEECGQPLRVTFCKIFIYARSISLGRDLRPQLPRHRDQ